MKKIILVLVVCLLSVSLTACNNTEYKEALSLIESGDYYAAYDILKELGDYKDSKQLLENFRYMPVKLVRNDGELLVNIDIAYSPCTLDYVGSIPSGEKNIFNYTYDADGNMLKVECAYRNGGTATVEYTYDDVGNLIKEEGVSSDSGDRLIEYAYDDNRNLVKKTYRYGIYEYEYDADGNLTKEIYTDPGTGGKVFDNYTYDANGNLIKHEVANSHGDSRYWEYSYDANGNQIEVSYTDRLGVREVVGEYAYDAGGNMTKFINMSSNDKHVYEYAYDSSGNLIREEYSKNDEKRYVHEYIYDDNGKLTRKEYTFPGDNEMFDEYTYDSSGNLTKAVYTDRKGNAEIWEYTYEWVYVPYELPEEVEDNLYKAGKDAAPKE